MSQTYAIITGMSPPSSTTTPPAGATLHWRPTPSGHEIALDGSTLVCRNSKGRLLKAVPPAVRKSAEATELLALREFLERHERECLATVETWMLGAFAIPVALLADLWPDPSWRAALTDLAVTTEPSAEPGLLRELGSGRVGVVNLDAETEWLETEKIHIPHPVLIEDLADVREFAAELGIAQSASQLTRDVHAKPESVSGNTVRDYANGQFDSPSELRARVARYGFAIRGSYAICHASDDGVELQARFWIGDSSDYYESVTGDLLWVGSDERTVPLTAVGPIAWSEGIRMAELIYAGRKTTQ
ncbi:DUF4132 domain-containing protein [Stackebrandtia soli]